MPHPIHIILKPSDPLAHPSDPIHTRSAASTRPRPLTYARPAFAHPRRGAGAPDPIRARSAIELDPSLIARQLSRAAAANASASANPSRGAGAPDLIRSATAPDPLVACLPVPPHLAAKRPPTRCCARQVRLSQALSPSA
jgi:hypothetical protein